MRQLSDLDKYMLALQCVEELANKKKLSLIESGDITQRDKDYFVRALGSGKAGEFFRALYKIDDIAESLDKKHIECLSLFDDRYPKELANIADRPVMLFAMGNLSALNTEKIAVVGTRRPTRYGVKACEEFTREFVRAGLTVVSGLARGTDGIAHRICVEQGAPTIAILACGLDVCYPPEHTGLAENIIATGGLMLSEYMLGVKPLQYHFPDRNRLISGLSRAVLIPEAAKKSGSLITARLAVEQGKDLFVVPGNIFSPESEGSNGLLREMPHALAIAPEDVLDALGIRRAPAEDVGVELDIYENMIVDALHDGERHFEDLLASTELSISELNTVLFNLQLKGIVDDVGGNFYALS